MNSIIQTISFEDWDRRYPELLEEGMQEPWYGGPLRRHVDDGDYRLLRLRYDPSAASLRLWNLLLTEESRLRQARADGRLLVGTMKDLGTVPVMAYSMPEVVAFYPDGAWWIPCVMEMSAGLFEIADSVGIDDSFCPVRAMIGAFANCKHFPIPDLLTCSVGATCDDFSAIAQRVEAMGHPILWWEIPARRSPDTGEEAFELPGGFVAPRSQVEFVESELERVRSAFACAAGRPLTEDMLSEGIAFANCVRRALAELRMIAYTAEPCPIPALEMQIAEMLAIHFCSDREESLAVMQDLVDEARRREEAGLGVMPEGAARVFWVNPVADIRIMNTLQECGARVCGTEYLFAHALDEIPEDIPPMRALAMMALADPMVGTAKDRAARICRDIREFGSEAVIVSRIPGGSHCATEGAVIKDIVGVELGIPVIEIEVPPLTDAMEPTIATRIQALTEIVMRRRNG